MRTCAASKRDCGCGGDGKLGRALFTLLRMGEIGQSVKMECVIAGGAISQMSRDPDRKT